LIGEKQNPNPSPQKHGEREKKKKKISSRSQHRLNQKWGEEKGKKGLQFEKLLDQ
jgi:hypothetical protein